MTVATLPGSFLGPAGSGFAGCNDTPQTFGTSDANSSGVAVRNN
jgi:hypothetical protein